MKHLKRYLNLKWISTLFIIIIVTNCSKEPTSKEPTNDKISTKKSAIIDTLTKSKEYLALEERMSIFGRNCRKNYSTLSADDKTEFITTIKLITKENNGNTIDSLFIIASSIINMNLKEEVLLIYNDVLAWKKSITLSQLTQNDVISALLKNTLSSPNKLKSVDTAYPGCLQQCWTEFLIHMLECSFTPPPFDLICASLASAFYIECCANCPD